MTGGHSSVDPGAVTVRLKMPASPAPTPFETGFGFATTAPVHGSRNVATWLIAATVPATAAIGAVIAPLATLTPLTTTKCAMSIVVLTTNSPTAAAPRRIVAKKPVPDGAGMLR